jgi:hypothetical protein
MSSSSSSSQDSSSFLKEPEPIIDLFESPVVNNKEKQQFSSIPSSNGTDSTLVSSPTKKKQLSQELLESDSCNESEPSAFYNVDFSVRKRSKSHKQDITKDNERFVKLYCMYIGNDTSDIDKRIDSLVKNKDCLCSKSFFRIKNSDLKKELQRRYHYLKVAETEPRYSNFELKRLKLYLNNKTYSLPKSEVQYVKHEISLFLQLHEVAVNNKNKEKDNSSKRLTQTDKQRMRLWEAVFLDDFREAFLKYNNCLTRQDIDGRHNPDKDETFLEMVLFKYNDPTWCPESEPMQNFSPRLKVSHLLPLFKKMKMTELRTQYTQMKGIFNKMINNYKRSGNGDLNIQDSSLNDSDTKNKSEGNTEDQFTDNSDKQNFCYGVIHYGYFWALAERNQLTSTVSQNCNSIGVSSMNSSSISSTSTTNIDSQSKKTKSKMNQEDKTDKMISVVMGMREEMNSATIDRAILLLKIELRESNQQHNDL